MMSRERVRAALTTGKEDRPPIMEMGIDWAVMKGLGYTSYESMIKGLDLDGIPVNQMLYTMGWRKWVIPHISLYTDEWGVKSRMTGELLPIPVEHPIPDWEALKKFKPPKPGRSPLLKAIRLARKHFPHRAVTVLSRNDFAASWFLCGMETLLMSFLLDPDFADRLFAMVSEYYCELYKLVIEAGADVIYLTDDYAYDKGTLMSREHFIRFVLPWLEKGVKTIHDAGGLCIKHSDGDLSGVMDLIVNTGVEGIGPLEPAAGNDLVKLRETLGKEITLVGNIDVDLLSRGTKNQVAAETRILMEKLGKSGRFILSSGNTISSSVKSENFRIMIETGRKYVR